MSVAFARSDAARRTSRTRIDVTLLRLRVRAILRRLDPNDDPDAEPLGLLPLMALAVAVGFSSYMYLRWKYQPMQDFGHHAALAAVVSDYGRPGSLYTPLYEPIDPLAANSLLYQSAGHLGRFIGVTNALRACMLLYVAGTPLATLYALRVFGRSPWAAVMAVPLVYNVIYIAGFANMLFATPFMVLSLTELYRALDEPTRWRCRRTAVLFILLFLAHAHTFLWTGALSFGMTVVFIASTLVRPTTWRATAWKVLSTAGVAAFCVAPSLMLFGHWYVRTFGAGRATGGVKNATLGWHEHFGAYFSSIQDRMTSFPASFKVYPTNEDKDLLYALLLVALVGVALACSSLHQSRRPPVLELSFVLSMVSFFFLPDGIKGHDVIASRRIPIALWLLPAAVSPVPAATSRIARLLVTLGICWLAGSMLRTWDEHLVKFEREEAAGLAKVMAAAPPRLRLHYYKEEPRSESFAWRPWWHVDKLYMSDALGQVADTPGILSTSPIRYRAGVDIHRLANASHDWGRNPDIWHNYDLVLVRRWKPSPAEVATAQAHGDRIAQSADWELWRSREATPIDLDVGVDAGK